jgi:5'-phosphate synthase pdxT subunit
MKPQVGVLALQGDYQAHAASLARLGHEAREVRRRRDLDGLHGVVLPGGESTTMWHFLDQLDLGRGLQEFARRGGALYGTCAGVILLAHHILNPPRDGLGILDVTVERNGYGRQTDSSIHSVPLQTGGSVQIILIRAPRIVRVGAAVTVRLSWHDDPLWVEQDRIMGTTFHPELGSEDRFHRRFLELASQAATASVPT